jgi:tRNA A-37 threonylcarbamoyl transferase component Bud32
MTEHTETSLGGRYRLDLRIATGGMGEVWRATDEVLNRPVAVKILRREYADEATFLERFRAEARNMAALTHPGIAAVHDFGQTRLGDAVVPYIVMELVPGEPLSAIIERGGPLAVDRALDLVAQAAWALQAAHEAGVVHRDVKPANLLVTPSDVVKVTDFGIARAADAVPLTRTGTVMGTAHYLAPEMASSRGAASPLSDVYALGVVLYECLAGRRPFPGDNPVTVALAHLQEEPPPLPSGVPEPVRRLVSRTLAKDPLNRPGNAGELARRLTALRASSALAEPTAGLAAGPTAGPVAEPVTTTVVGPSRRARQDSPRQDRARQDRRSRGPELLMGVGALLVALAAAWLVAGMGPGSATVPDVTGLLSADAQARLSALGFPIEIKREVNRKVRSGVVLQQRPIPGTESSTKSPVLLVVSAGPPRVRVDDADWRGRPLDEVESALRRRGLEVTVRSAAGSGEAGTVSDVAPDGLVTVGGTVTVTVIESAEGRKN